MEKMTSKTLLGNSKNKINKVNRIFPHFEKLMLPRPFHISLQSFVGLFYTNLSVSKEDFSPLNLRAPKLQVFENLGISSALLSTTPTLIFGGPRDTIFMQMLSNFGEVAKYGCYICG